MPKQAAGVSPRARTAAAASDPFSHSRPQRPPLRMSPEQWFEMIKSSIQDKNKHQNTENKIQSMQRELKNEEFQKVLDYKDENGNTALHFAAEANDEHLLRILLRNGANPLIGNNKKQRASQLDSVPENSYIKKLLKQAELDYFMFKSLENGDIEKMVKAIQKGADSRAKNPKGQTILDVAREIGGETFDIVKEVLHAHYFDLSNLISTLEAPPSI